MIASGGHEGQLLAVRTPLHIEESATGTGDVIGGGRAVCIGLHVQPYQAWLRFEMNHQPLDHEDVFITKQWILPGIQLRMPHLGGIQIHVPDFATVVTEGGYLAGIWRPQQNRTIPAYPAGVIGCVTIVLDAIESELGTLTGFCVANPEVVIFDIGRLQAVGRQVFVIARAGNLLQLERAEVRPVTLAIEIKLHDIETVIELDRRQREVGGVHVFVTEFGQCLGQQHRIEQICFASGDQIGDLQHGARLSGFAIDQPVIVLPVIGEDIVYYQIVGVLREKLFGTLIVSQCRARHADLLHRRLTTGRQQQGKTQRRWRADC